MTTGKRIDIWIVNRFQGLLTNKQYETVMVLILMAPAFLEEFNNSLTKEET